MQKKLVYVTLILISTLIIIRCLTNEKPPVTALTISPSSYDSATLISKAQNKNSDIQDQYKEMVVQRNYDCFSFQKNQIANQGIVLDIQNLLFIVPRGGAGITDIGIEKDSSELSIINESDNFIKKHLNADTSDKKYTYIRLIYDSYIPQEAENATRHKDIIIYLQPDNSNDAIFAIQDPVKQSKWTITTLVGYGDWLTKEIDILLRIKTGL